MKNEYERLMKQKFNISDMKHHIEEIILLIHDKGLVDEEVKYNIFLCNLYVNLNIQLSKDKSNWKAFKDNLLLD